MLYCTACAALCCLVLTLHCIASMLFLFLFLVDVEHTNVRFLGSLVLNLWDCGGQYRFFENYFESDTIFRNVEVLIYVFDIDSGDYSNDITLFVGILEAMERCSPDASIFILIHKMDLINEEDREREFMDRSALVQSKSDQ